MVARKAGFTFRCLELSWESEFLPWALDRPGVWGNKGIHTQVAAFPFWVSVPRCLVGKELGSRPAPVSAPGVSWSHFLLNAEAREVRQVATLSEPQLSPL